MMKKSAGALSALVLFFCCGCAVSNNSCSLKDFADHLEKSGVRIEAVQPLFVNYGAVEAITFHIAGSPIGVYRFDTNIKRSAEKLAVLKKKGYVFFNADKYPAMFNGSFMFVRYESNKEKKAIVRAIRSF